MRPIKIAVTCGDYNGIGPEIILKAFCDNYITSLAEFFIFGSPDIFNLTSEKLPFIKNSGMRKSLDFCNNKLYNNSQLNGISSSEFNPGTSSSNSGKIAHKYLDLAVNFCLENKIDALVTGPIQKSTFFTGDQGFTGQTELLIDRFNADDGLMIMVNEKIKIATVTTHLPVKNIASALTKKIIIEKGRILINSLRKDFNIKSPEIAVSGLNPHSGDNGMSGKEEMEYIKPSIDELKSLGGEWSGPFSADSLFTRKNINKYDAFLTMYHDQGLIPFKMISELSGVNFTAGLPVVRTSPDHGVAMDISGTGTADEQSMKEAIKLAAYITKNRKNIS